MEQNTNNSIYPLTLGKKIKKLRLLRGLSQKELGIKVGFSPETADTRIRQYEKDAMAPKSEIRKRLAAVPTSPIKKMISPIIVFMPSVSDSR